MTTPESQEHRKRVIEQFSYQGPRAEIWKGFDLFLDTGAFLNLGYSPWYLPHVIGSSQRRLATKIANDLAAFTTPQGQRLVDVGCGRGGPSLSLASHGYDVTGIDLVPYNITRAAANATDHGTKTSFVIGDASNLPFRDNEFHVGTAIDSPVYIAEKHAFFTELARVIEPGGIMAIADLVARHDATQSARDRLAAAVDAWDFATIQPASTYYEDLRTAGFEIIRTEDISPNSTDRFTKWARLFLALATTPIGTALATLFARRNIDFDRIVEQVRRTYHALPRLNHLLIYARNDPSSQPPPD